MAPVGSTPLADPTVQRGIAVPAASDDDRSAPTERRRSRALGVDAALVSLPAVVTTMALLAVAHGGPYASPDSAFYVGVARNLAGGDGLVAPPGSAPIVHFPPLFAIVLGGLGRLFGADPLDVAAVVNPLLAGLVVLLVAVIVRRRTGSLVTGVAAGALAGSGLDVLVYGASALSEPLFLALVICSIALISEAVARRSNTLLAAAAGSVGAACLTRYLGIALVVAGATAILRLEGGRGRRRALAFTAGALAGPAVWLVWAGASDRPLALHAFDLGYWTLGVESASQWVLPQVAPLPLRLLVSVAAAVALWRLARTGVRTTSSRPTRHDPMGIVLVVFSLGYVALVLAYRLFLDQSARIDARFLGPLHLVAIIAVLSFVHRRLDGPPSTSRATATRVVLGVGGAALAFHGVHAVGWVARGLGDDSVGRRGLTARSWRESAVLRMVAVLPPGVPVYTNAADAVHLLTGRAVTSVPAEYDQFTGRPNPRFGADVDAIRGALEGTDGVVVYFLPLRGRAAFLPSADELQRLLGLSPVARDEVAVAYRSRAP